MTIFERIKELADKQGKSLQKISEELGFSSNYLYQLKRQTPAADKLALIADYFDVSVDYLLGRPDKSTFKQQNRIREFRKKKKLSLSELAQKVNIWLDEEFNDFYRTINNKPIKFNAQKVLSLENNELIITPEESSPVWMAFSEVLGVDDRYLEGISDVEPLEKKFRIGKIDDLKKELSPSSLSDDEYVKKYLETLDEKQIKRLTWSQLELKEYVGENTVKKIRDQYSKTETVLEGITRTYMRDYFALLDALYSLKHEFLEADYQILLTLAQLTPKYQAKALEQVKNLLIVQKVAESTDKI
ncbi:transcriptional regulator with XRE-family HTH domain [Lactococcus lactis]|uniref:Transcriptional regulator with XRE-family HTH domain n=1 Tax=Lactococcus lactis TaxID=1358 RepID=A0AAW5TS50_9LACT|nr:transcriptional regulator with XRE-family HTH domain [Lactococcus lactis]